MLVLHWYTYLHKVTNYSCNNYNQWLRKLQSSCFCVLHINIIFYIFLIGIYLYIFIFYRPWCYSNATIDVAINNWIHNILYTCPRIYICLINMFLYCFEWGKGTVSPVPTLYSVGGYECDSIWPIFNLILTHPTQFPSRNTYLKSSLLFKDLNIYYVTG